MVIFSGPIYEQSLLHILKNMVPEAVSEMTLHNYNDMLRRNHVMGWQKKIDRGWTCIPKNGLG